MFDIHYYIELTISNISTSCTLLCRVSFLYIVCLTLFYKIDKVQLHRDLNYFWKRRNLGWLDPFEYLRSRMIDRVNILANLRAYLWLTYSLWEERQISVFNNSIALYRLKTIFAQLFSRKPFRKIKLCQIFNNVRSLRRSSAILRIVFVTSGSRGQANITYANDF